MELSSFNVNTVKSKFLPMEETLIIPISDIQYGSQGCDLERFKRLIKWGVKNNAYYVGLGDMVDFASPSNRSAIRSQKETGAFYDSTLAILERGAEQDLEVIKKILEPTKGRWLGMLHGHHHYIFEDGTTTDTRLCQFLGAPFLGTSALVEVKFKSKNKKDRHSSPSFTIWMHHGQGGGDPIAKLKKIVPHFEADVFLVAHNHVKKVEKIPRLKRVGKELVSHNMILACTGGYLNGYSVGSKADSKPHGGYVEKAMMAPLSLGSIALWARPKRNHDGYSTVDLDVSL